MGEKQARISCLIILAIAGSFQFINPETFVYHPYHHFIVTQKNR